MAEEMKRGIFITFEGCEGSGKSTQAKRLYNELLSKGFKVSYTREPGATLLGKKIRNILLKKDNIRLSKEVELFLFEADRAQHVQEIIKPNLEKGRIIICDRFNTATFAYQGYGLGVDLNLIKTIDKLATLGVLPDLVILLDIDVKTGLLRASKKGARDRMEKRALKFHKRVRQGYLAIAKKNPNRFRVIKVKGDLDKTYNLVRSEVFSFLTRLK